MPTKAITSDTLAELLKKPEKLIVFWDGGHDKAIKCFGLKVRANGNASWLVQKDKSHTIGKATGSKAISLTEARAEARKWTGAVNAGDDPFELKKKLRVNPTFGELAAAWQDTQRAKHAAGNMKRSALLTYERSVRLYIEPTWKDVRFRDITRKAVRDWTLELAKQVPGFCSKAVGHCSQIVLHGIREGLVVGDALTLALTNPFSAVETKPKRVVRKRIAKPPEYRRIQEALADPRYTDGYRSNTKGRRQALIAIEMLLLSGKRKGQVLGIKLSDIHDNEGYVRVEGKMKDDETMVLTGELRRLIAKAKAERGDHESDWLFPALNQNPKGSSNPVDRLWNAIRKDQRLFEDIKGQRDYLTLHDLRRSYNSVGDHIGVRFSVLAALLCHGLRSTLVSPREDEIDETNFTVYTQVVDSTMTAAAEKITAKIRSYRNNDTDAGGPDTGDSTRQGAPESANDNDDFEDQAARHS